VIPEAKIAVFAIKKLLVKRAGFTVRHSPQYRRNCLHQRRILHTIERMELITVQMVCSCSEDRADATEEME
jgi:hypothetical protein